LINPWHILAVFFATAIAFAASITYVLALDANGSPPSASQESAGWDLPPDRFDCNEIYGTAFSSDNERNWFSENCSTWSKNVGDVPDPVPQSGRGEDEGSAAMSWLSPSGRTCGQMAGTGYRSAEERAWYLAHCQNLANTPAPASSPRPGIPSQGSVSWLSPDGRSCDQIRGAVYSSAVERDWYLAHCQKGTPTPQATASGPDRTDCIEIRGTSYRSANERLWYLANCDGR
jgi:hypothetical protein